MNIRDAKQEIENTLKAYHLRDDRGHYRIPTLRQRPILLMGPPGIGKTAILEQISRETGVGLVSYTMTHHTRQSAVGLPRIMTRNYDGEEYAVTEYTMSEIVASVYTYMERTGLREGILFLDEINCVSETLAPTMLQLLQNKTFGTHKLPEGWILVAAGNPPEFNKSVREFDVATLDRIRTIPVEADCQVWLGYAQERKLHGAIPAYLSLRPQDFYLVEQGTEGTAFVTARGWEDLSGLLKAYEALNLEIGQAQVGQYLQKEEVAREFAAFYQLYRKYGQDYRIPAILEGEDWAAQRDLLRKAGFEERFMVVQLLMDGLETRLEAYSLRSRRLQALHESLLRLKRNWGEGPGALAEQMERSLRVRQEAGALEEAESADRQWAIEQLREYSLELDKAHLGDPEQGIQWIRERFSEDALSLDSLARQVSEMLHRAFAFAEDCFGEGQEMVLLMTDLTRSPRAMEFISENGSEDFLRHSQVLQTRQQEKYLQDQCRSLLDQGL